MPPFGVSICVSAISLLRRQRVGAQPVEERFRPGPETSYFAKLVWSRTPTAERTARHSSPTASNQLPRRKEYSSCAGPFRENQPLPPEADAEDRAFREQSFVERVELQRPPSRPFLLGEVDLVLVLEDLGRPGDDVGGVGREVAEAADVELPHVVRGLSVDDPLRRITGAAGEDDAEDAEAGEDVELPQPRTGPIRQRPSGV